jgi:3,4-dihydroxy 2-butanone 4-phosphate synthase/GTP cyclohydrolase II
VNDALTRTRSEFADRLSPIEDIIVEARSGRMFILVDAEGRENEGDLVIPAEFANADTLNFMAKHGRGLICLALARERAEHLGLEQMSRKSRPRRHPDFTVSIEARQGISTGISTADRAHTIAVAINPTSTSQDISTPGHVFPLVARDGGVLVRAGRTEAAVDVARLAGLRPSGVLCEIINEDGAMARLPDIVSLADRYGLKIATIADLIAFRLRRDHLVVRMEESTIESAFGGRWQLVLFRNSLDHAEHVALVKGDVSTPGPVLVRVHALNILRDVLGAAGAANDAVRKAMIEIAREGRGAIVLVRDMQHYAEAMSPSPGKGPDRTLREYGVGAQILLALGVREMILLSNTEQTIIALNGYGLVVSGRRPLP